MSELLSNLSYTNKDFQTIYPELLNLVKEQSPKWDPTISNESDPGVLLIKLNALIADKNNYQIDKGVLECFPESVTQDGNARQLFEQLGYTMHWRRAASTQLSLAWVQSSSDDSSETQSEEVLVKTEEGKLIQYNIPLFTMFSDVDNSVIYTNIDAGATMTLDGTVTTINVLQGVAVDYNLSGEKLLTVANLDSNNRLYFSDNAVAENGIFIANYNTLNQTNQYNYGDWTRVNNLSTQELGQKVYQFGVTQDGSDCYIEFPDDIDTLIGGGIYITYIRTDGEAGNIASQVIEQPYSDTTLKSITTGYSDAEVRITKENTKITNVYAAIDGKDPEDIDEAYRNYKKTIGTYNTLVTLRDYVNAIYNTELVSNCFVCDRTNDIQNSYYIMTDDDGLYYKELQVKSGKKDLDLVTNKLTNIPMVFGYYAPGLSISEGDAGKIAQLINNFEIEENYYGNTLKVSCSNFYSQYHNGEFTDLIVPECDKLYFDLLTSTVYLYNDALNNYAKATDAETKTLKIDKPELDAFSLKLYMLTPVKSVSTYSAYNESFTMIHNTDKIKEIQNNISDYKNIQHDYINVEDDRICYIKNKYPISCKIIPQYKVTDLQAQEIQINIIKALYDRFNARRIDFGEEVSYDTIYSTIINADQRIKAAVLDDLLFTAYAVIYDSTKKEYIDIDISDNIIEAYITDDNSKAFSNSSKSILLQPVVGRLYGKYEINGEIETCYIYSSVKKLYQPLCSYKTFIELRKEIYAKSVLCGATQLLPSDNNFQFSLTHQNSKIIPDVYKVTTESTVEVFSEGDTKKKNSYLVKDNEAIQFFAPSLVEDKNYSSYVRYDCLLNAGVVDDDSEEDKRIYIQTQQYTFSLLHQFIVATTLKLKDNMNNIYTDDGQGQIIRVSDSSIVGTVDYSYGAVQLDSTQFSSQIKTMSATYKYNKSIPANSDYSLKDGEYIVFYWKTDDTEYSAYNYYKYSSQTDIHIISPNFLLTTTAQTPGKLLSDGSGFTTPAVTIEVQGMLSQSLSGTKSISTKKRNKVDVGGKDNQSQQYCYWILNNKVKDDDGDKFQLFSEDEKEYMLRSGEYFIYTNASKTVLNILGSGTKIQRIKDDESVPGWDAWRVPVISYDAIEQYGIDAFNDEWKTFSYNDPGNPYVVVEEMQYYNMGTDVTVTFTKKSDADMSKLVLSNTPIELGNKYIITYESEGTESELPVINIGESETEVGWSCRTVLNIKTSKTQSQKVYKHQKISCYNYDSESSIDIVGTSEEGKITHILSDYPINLDGGEDIEIQVYSLSDDVDKYVSFYQYDVETNPNKKNIKVKDQNYTLTLTPQNPSAEVDIGLDAGDYLIPVKISNFIDLTDFYLQLIYKQGEQENTEYLCPINKEIPNLTDSNIKTYYVKLHISNSYEDIKLKVTEQFKGESKEENVVYLNTLYKYKFDEASKYIYNKQDDRATDINLDDIINEVIRLDPKSLFDYTYEVNSDEEVKYPLSGAGLLSIYHPYNEFSICQIDTSKIDLPVLNKLK